MRRAEKPSLRGVHDKVKRAKLHFENFKRKARIVRDRDPDAFIGQVHNNGFDHVYYAVRPPLPRTQWSLSIGDCVHNLRSALDHLAYQLVRANNGTPTIATQFPLHKSRTRMNPSTGLIEPRPYEVSGGVHPAALALIQGMQPYEPPSQAKTLGRLHDLDVIDKHRHLLLSVVAVDWYARPVRPGRFETVSHWRALSLKDGKPAMRLTYRTPEPEVDPELTIARDVAFGSGISDLAGDPVVGILDLMITVVDRYVIPQFARFFT
jgi:hypothetical protein